MSQRKTRVEHAMRDVLTELIASEVKDPRVHAATLVSVTRVELNVDMAVAQVYVSVVPATAAAPVLAGLAKAAGFLPGTMAGLASLLRAVGKTAVMYSVDPIARRYRWLPLVNTTVHAISFDERFDCTVVVDCADITLLGDTLPPPEVCGTLITLDHHA